MLKIFLSIISFFIILFFYITISSNSNNYTTIDPNIGKVDFKKTEKGNWNNLCILEPYSSNETAYKLLGFNWDLESKSEIFLNDGITLLIFSNSTNVISFKEIRRSTDFSKFANQCFDKNLTQFYIKNAKVTYIGNDNN